MNQIIFLAYKKTEICLEIKPVLKFDSSKSKITTLGMLVQPLKSPKFQENNLVNMFEDMTTASLLFRKKTYPYRKTVLEFTYSEKATKIWKKTPNFICRYNMNSKGQLISKCLFGVVVLTKIATSILQGFLP